MTTAVMTGQSGMPFSGISVSWPRRAAREWHGGRCAGLCGNTPPGCAQNSAQATTGSLMSCSSPPTALPHNCAGTTSLAACRGTAAGRRDPLESSWSQMSSITRETPSSLEKSRGTPDSPPAVISTAPSGPRRSGAPQPTPAPRPSCRTPRSSLSVPSPLRGPRWLVRGGGGGSGGGSLRGPTQDGGERSGEGEEGGRMPGRGRGGLACARSWGIRGESPPPPSLPPAPPPPPLRARPPLRKPISIPPALPRALPPPGARHSPCLAKAGPSSGFRFNAL